MSIWRISSILIQVLSCHLSCTIALGGSDILIKRDLDTTCRKCHEKLFANCMVRLKFGRQNFSKPKFDLRRKLTGILKRVGAAHEREFSSSTDKFPYAVKRVLYIARAMGKSENGVAVTVVPNFPTFRFPIYNVIYSLYTLLVHFTVIKVYHCFLFCFYNSMLWNFVKTSLHVSTSLSASTRTVRLASQNNVLQFQSKHDPACPRHSPYRTCPAFQFLAHV